MSRTIKIFDTTLRDGEQALPQSLSMRQKLQIALALEELGVDVVIGKTMDYEYARTSREDFIASIATNFKVKAVVCGEDCKVG